MEPRSTKYLAGLTLGITLMMFAVTAIFAAPYADAGPAATCSEGTLVDGLCEIVGTPPTPGPAVCPVSATVMSEDGMCYRVVDPLAQPPVCPPSADIGLVDGQCRQSVALLPGPLVCQAGFALVDGLCIRQELPTLACPAGATVVVGGCLVDLGPAVPGPGVCPVSATVILEDGVCFRLLAPATTDPITCPAAADIGLVEGQCRQSVPLQPGALTCPAGAGIIDGHCFRFEPPTLICSVGAALVDGICIITQPPTPGPGVCPVSTDVFFEDGVCFGLVDPVPQPTVCGPDADLGLVNGECRQSVALVPGALRCDAGFGLVGGRCIRYEEPQSSAAAAKANGAALVAALSGAAEVPGPGDSDGSGSASVRINRGQGLVCFELVFSGIDAITAAHIHAGAAGQAGGVVVDLAIAANGLNGCVNVDKAVAKAIDKNPSDYYVNVHTALFPAGAIRGQLG